MPRAAIVPVVALILGVLIGSQTSIDRLAPVGLCLGLVLAISISGFMKKCSSVVLWSTAFGYLLVGGILSVRAHEEALHSSLVQVLNAAGLIASPSVLRGEQAAPLIIEAVLREDAAVGPTGVRLSVAVDRIWVDHQPRHVAGGVVLSVAGQQAPRHLDEWRAGRRIRCPAVMRRPARYLDPGVPDAERALALKGTVLVGTVKSAALVERLASGSWLAEPAGAARSYVRRAIRAHVACWSGRSAAIVTAILIGDRAGLDDEVERRLQEAGTYHVLAISGGNIAILAGLLLIGFRISGFKPWANLVIVAVLTAYAGIANAETSVVRATIMAGVYFTARLRDLRTSALDTLLVAAVLIVTVAPLAVYDVGFVLSFGATLGLLAGAQAWPTLRTQSWWRRASLQLLIASISSEAILLPVAARAFSRVTFAGLILNFAAIPLMAVAQLSGLAVLLFQGINERLARASGFVAHLAADGLVSSAELVDWLPQLVVRTPPPSIGVILAYYAALLAWFAARSIRRDVGTSARWANRTEHGAGLGAAAVLSWILAAPVVKFTGSSPVVVTIFDVGQGDAAMVRLPDGHSILIDCGGSVMPGGFDMGARVLAPALWAAGVRRLDYLAVTHGDPDHMGGAESIVRDFRPGEVWQGVPVPAHQPTNALKAVAASAHAAWRTLVAGDALDLGHATLRVWHPPLPDWERPKVRNDDSLVFEIRLGQVSFVFTGDIGSDVESELASRIPPAAIRILKVPHHGSLTSSSEEFLRALRPAAAIFSVGRDNRFGHPHPIVLERYRRLGIQIFRTDEDGMVTIESDGKRVDISTFTGRSVSLSKKAMSNE